MGMFGLTLTFVGAVLLINGVGELKRVGDHSIFRVMIITVLVQCG